MAIQSAEDLFLTMLSNLQNSETRLASNAGDLAQLAQNKEVKEVLDVRAFIAKQNAANIDECFRLLGKKPVQTNQQFRQTWLEDVRREAETIQTPALKAIYVIGAFRQIQNLHLAEYATLVAIARLMNNMPVATLLQSNLADKVMFVKRTDDMIRDIGATAFATRMREKAA
ncbi:MAG: DUF892 family protein [Chloroflexi bacterium]|nr:DUF892 family protein [Chloroflexota bacterium]